MSPGGETFPVADEKWVDNQRELPHTLLKTVWYERTEQLAFYPHTPENTKNQKQEFKCKMS